MSEITILIPTYERPNKLARALKYYNNSGSKIPILIVDGSSQKYSGPLPKNVEYHHLPKQTSYERFLTAVKFAKTDLVALASDDDFSNVDFLEDSVRILNNSANYSCVVGRNYLFDLERITNWQRPHQFCTGVEDSSPKTRLESFFSNYTSLIYSPTKRYLLLDVLENSLNVLKDFDSNHSRINELMLGARIVLSGKVAFLDKISLIRERRTKCLQYIPLKILFQTQPETLAFVQKTFTSWCQKEQLLSPQIDIIHLLLENYERRFLLKNKLYLYTKKIFATLPMLDRNLLYSFFNSYNHDDEKILNHIGTILQECPN